MVQFSVEIWGIKMKKIYVFGIASLLIIILFIVVLNNNSNQNKISNQLGIDVSGGTEISQNDTHGGFHGDGMYFASISFSDNTVLKQISEKGNWGATPLTENLSTLVYGTTTDNGRFGPYLTDEDGKTVIPGIQNGYFYFADRHSQSTNRHDDTDVLNRHSFNFTFAIYDINTNILYYIEYDT